MFTFSQIVTALARLHKIPPESEKAFRARIQNFQRIGLVFVSPGKGKKIAYEKEQVFLWAIALEFSEFGIDPTVTKKISDVYWKEWSVALNSDPLRPDRLLWFHPKLIGKSFAPAEQQSSTNPSGVPFSLTCKVVNSPADISADFPKNDALQEALGFYTARYGVINLSWLRRRVEAQLAAVA